jgi:methyl-accepting chemotaxis protein
MKNSRKIYLINPAFQMRFVAFSIISSLIVIILVAGMQYYFFNHYQNLGIQNGIPSDHIFFEFLREQRNFITVALSILAVIITLVQVTLGILFSHRVAGPIYRMNQHMQGITSGEEPSTFKVRDGDYFQELVDNFNSMILKLERKKD